MAGDLGMTESEVDSAAGEVNHFWFGLPKEKRFAKDHALDAAIRERFGALRQQVHDTAAEEWRDDPRHLLAAVILLDQFSRNLFRGEARAFASDGIARGLTDRAIDKGWDAGMAAVERVFLYMPLMHGEDAASQARSMAMFADLGIAENLAFAKDHAAVIGRFGRFPSRNAALGRETTEAERAYLADGGGW